MPHFRHEFWPTIIQEFPTSNIQEVKNSCYRHHKILLWLFIISALFLNTIGPLSAGELKIDWDNEKISITAKDVTVCDLLSELAAKTNINVRNQNKCDYPINLNINNKSIDEAIKKIFKKDSYTLVDNGTDMELIVFDRNSGEYSSKSDSVSPGVSSDNQMREEFIAPEPVEQNIVTPAEMPEQYDNSQDNSAAIANESVENSPAATDTGQPPAEDYPTDPIFDSQTLENGAR